MTTPQTTRPRLSHAAIAALRDLGLTPAQVQAINRRLPSIAHALEPKVSMRDVRDILRSVKQYVAGLAAFVRQAESGLLPAYSAAMGQLQFAAGLTPGEPPDGSGLGLLPESPDFVASVRLQQAFTSAALANLAKTQSRGRRDPAQAVESLLSCLAEPSDSDSRALARRAAKPASAPSKANPFADIAEEVFRAATGAQSVNLRAAVDAWRKRKELWGRQPAPKTRTRR